MRLTKSHWLSAVLLFALISGAVVHLIATHHIEPTNQQYPLNTLDESAQRFLETQEVTILTVKLAELQGQVLRLNALGERLADDANIPKKEFNFTQIPASGGPALPNQFAESKTLAQLLSEISQLEQELKHEEKQLDMLESVTFGHHIENNRYLSGRPISKGWLSSYYGMRKDPFHGRPSMHKGVDFAGKEDAAIIATGSGVVTWAGKRNGYGKLVEITHGDGMKTRYGHNKNLLVAIGDVIDKGQVIARMGSTGRSTGPHVHYEILRNNTQIDPIKYVYRKAKN
jgi:murein DD-endopeptidase MepM/ murein hydrolase activator NlpD